MTRINYKSDLDFLLRLHTLDGMEVGWPQYDWSAWLYVSGNRVSRYAVSCRGGVTENCFEDGGAIHVVMNGHQLPPGELMCEFRAELPNGIYPDGIRLQVSPFPVGIELVSGACDELPSADISVILPYIKGEPGADGADGKSSYLYAQEAGYAGTEEQFAADLAAVSSKQDKLRTSADLDISAEGVLSLTEQGKRATFDETWKKAGGTVVEAGKTYALNGIEDLTFENALAILLAGRIKNNAERFFAGNDALRTNLPATSTGSLIGDGNYTFQSCHNLEVADATGLAAGITTFYGCSSLHTILNMYSLNGSNLAQGCFRTPSLVNVFGAIRYGKPIDFQHCPHISLESVAYWVENKLTDAAVTITVHHDVYAKLTDAEGEDNAEWHQVLLDAIDKQISFATV